MARQGQHFFFEKKKQKTFIHKTPVASKREQRAKVFWFLFSKQNAFFFSAFDPPSHRLLPPPRPQAKTPVATT
jgi:hypothetical protein